MNKIILSIITVIFFALAGYSQKEQIIKLSKSNKSYFNSEIKSKNSNLFEISISEIKLTETQIKNNKFVNLQANGLIKTYNVGLPNLPVISKLIEVPIGAKVKFKIVSFDEEIIDFKKHGILKKIAPAQASVWKSGDKKENFYYNQTEYSKDYFDENEIAIYENAGILRDKRIGRIEIKPFSYNPKKNILKILNNLKIEIIFENVDYKANQDLKTKYSSPFFNNLPNILLKPETENKNIIISTPITYVIVSPPDFESSLQSFIAWKKTKGFKVIEAYTNNPSVGTSKESIKAYLQNLYENPQTGYNPPSYILFVGDIAQIPSWNGLTDNHITDLYYCEYTGDKLPEVYYGRFSAQNTTHLNNMISKTLNYEKYLMTDPEYLGKHLLVAGVDPNYASTYGNGAIRYITNNYSNATNDLSSKYYLYGDASGGMASEYYAASSSVISDLNSGYGLANYTAHCSYQGWADPNVVISDLVSVNNYGKYGLWIGNCCESVRFENSECFGEAVLRLADRGAIGYIGGSDNTLWDEDYWWQIGLSSNISAYPTYEETETGAYDGAFHNKINEIDNFSKWYTSQGQINVCGNLAVQSSTSSYRDYYWEIYHLMGDPSLMPYLKIPTNISASVNPTNLILGINQITVTTEARAYVALSQNNELIIAAFADENGIAVLNFSSADLNIGDALIVVTAQNKIPFIETKTVVPAEEPYIILDEKYFNQNTRNGNTITINAVFKNVAESESGYDATNASTILSTNSSFIQISDNSEEIGDITAGESKMLNNAFEIQISENTPDQEIIPCDITISHDGYIRVSKFQFIVDAPNLTAELVDYIETSNQTGFLSTPVKTVSINSTYNYNIEVGQTKGNNNSLPDAGEELSANFKITNNGHADIQNITCTLSSENAYVQILNPSIEITSLLAETYTDDVHFQIVIAETTPLGENINFKLTTESGSIFKEFIFSTTTGLQKESFESGNLRAFNWQTSGHQNWAVSNENAFDGNYCAHSGDISDSQNSELNLEINSQINSKISFYKKVSSESSFDFLIFYIDNIEKGKWSGEIDWTKEEYDISEGIHTIKWKYVKDGSESSGTDKAWIDNIYFPPLSSNSKKIEAAYTISATTKPNWLNFTDNGNGTALLTGTTPSDETTEQIAISATDGITSAKQSFDLNVQNQTNIENIKSEIIKVYPIPANDKIYIDMPINFITAEITITDINGKNLYTKNIYQKNHEINLVKLAKGIYFLNINTDKESFTKKIIIK